MCATYPPRPHYSISAMRRLSETVARLGPVLEADPAADPKAYAAAARELLADALAVLPSRRPGP